MKPSILKTRNLKNLDLDRFNHILTIKLDDISTSISNLSSTCKNRSLSLENSLVNLSDTVSELSKALLSSFDDVAPIVTINNASKCKPWVSKDIRSLMKERDKSYRTAKQSCLYVDFMKFRFLRNRVSNSLNTAKNAYFASRLRTASDLNSKWHVLRKLGIANKKVNSPFNYLSASTLNTHYANVARKLPPLHTDDTKEILESLPVNPGLPLFNFSKISREDVLSAITSSTSKTFGIDSISSNMLKLAAPRLADHLCHIFNLSVQNGIFPHTWKRTLISPLLKKSPPDSPSDTRPIARLSEVSKVFERIVHKQLSSFLESNSLLDPSQFGFRTGKSTQLALLEVLEFARLGIENRQLTILVLFDFEKAFDSVSHKILLQKLRRLNCSDEVIQWFASYLSRRNQAVISDDDMYSDWLEMFTGVPQGSVLGPLLFLIFINDLYKSLSMCKHTLFADDLQIYLNCHPADLDSGLKQINDEVAAVFNWAKVNGIRLNLKKTKVMILGSKGYIPNVNLENLCPIVVDNITIPFVTEHKNLGLVLSPTLSWERHVSTVSVKVHQTLFTLRQARHALSFSLRKHLVESLIFPHLDYACICLSDIDATQNLRLQRLQNACTRFVFGRIKPLEHVTPFRLSLGWLSTARRREYLIAGQAYALLSDRSKNSLASRFTRVHEQATVRRTNRLIQHHLLQPFAKSQSFERSFTVTATKLLNQFNVTSFDLNILADLKVAWLNMLRDLEKSDWETRVVNEGLSVSKHISIEH